MIYVCSYGDCSLHGVGRAVDGELLTADDPLRACPGTATIEGADGTVTVRPCLRAMDASLPDGDVNHVEMVLPDLPPPPPVDPQPSQPPIPSPQDAMLGALQALDPAAATVADVIGAVTGALVASAATPVSPADFPAPLPPSPVAEGQKKGAKP